MSDELAQQPYSIVDVPEPAALGRIGGRPFSLVLSCEHAGNLVPDRFNADFGTAGAALASHRGYDPGALPLAQALARAWNVPLIHCTVSRLLVELNRSTHHPRWLSEWTRHYGKAERAFLRQWLYDPYRNALESLIEAIQARGRAAVHLSVHSFTPFWEGAERQVDLGLLYDPRRGEELSLCRRWARELGSELPHWKVRRNAPYRGAADGLTTALRKRWDSSCYLGIELEARNDRLADPAPLAQALVSSLARAVEPL